MDFSRPLSGLLFCFLVAISMQAKAAPTAYLPLGADPRLERQVEKMLALTGSAPLTKPYRITQIASSTERIRVSHPLLYQAIRDGIRPYLSDAQLVRAGIGLAVDGDTSSTLANQRGLSSTEWAEFSVDGVWRPSRTLLAQAGMSYRAEAGTLVNYNTFVSAGFGRLQFDVGYKEHWWSPFDHSAMLISNHARPSPSVTVSFSEPLENYWDANFEIFYSKLDSVEQGIRWQGSFYDGRPNLVGTHFSVKPFQGLQLGFNRIMQLGGGPRDLSFGDFLKAFVDPVSADNLAEPDREAGDQLASITGQLDMFLRGKPFELYFEHAGEDTVSNSNYKLGNQANSVGFFFPDLTQTLALRYEWNKWKTSWYLNGMYKYGNTNHGNVFGHFGGDQRVFGEGVPSQVHTMSLDYFGSRNDFWQLKLGVVDNDSNIDGRPTAFAYKTGYNVELFNSRNWRNYRLETQLTLGKSVFDQSYQHLSVSLFLH
jgi:hypothetical protein